MQDFFAQAPPEYLKALDLVARRYNLRPSELLEQGADSFGFDLAVALSSLRVNGKETIRKETLSKHDENPMAFFKKMGTTGWNQGKN